MRNLVIVAAVLYGAYWYASSKFNFESTLAYARRNPQASWSVATEYYVGMVYYQRAEYQKAQETFEQMLVVHSTGPYSARALLRLASSAEENRNYQLARESLQRYLDEFPNEKNRSIAEQKLEVIKFK